MRQGENALDVIDRVKERIREIEPGLPPGVEIVPIYDRSDLIRRAIDNVTRDARRGHPHRRLHRPAVPVARAERAHPAHHHPGRRAGRRSSRSAALGITANIMSLGGIAIAMGELVDAAIVVVEQTHKKLEERSRDGRDASTTTRSSSRRSRRWRRPASSRCSSSPSRSCPVLTLEAQEGRLFKPLAYTKTLAMIVAACLAITLDPALRLLFTRVRRFEFRPRVAVPRRQRGARRPHPLRGDAPDQPRPDPRSTSRSCAGRCAGSGR